MSLQSKKIKVGDHIGESSKIRIYLGNMDDKQPVILKVAKTFEDNDILAAEAREFNILRIFNSNAKSLSGAGEFHYDWLFANLHSSFIEPAQGDRRINIFTIPDIEFEKLVPLPKLSSKIEIDARSSAWIFGRFLKFYNIFEQMAILTRDSTPNYPLFSPGDYLIGPREHRLIYYNFSDGINDAVAFDFIKIIAKFILSWTVAEGNSADERYFNLLKDFSKTGRETFAEAHREFYDLIKELWGIHYYPFTYCERGSINWKKIKED